MASTIPSERVRRELERTLAGVDRDDDPVETIARLGARLILQVALESEVEGFSCAQRRPGRLPQRL
jgi:hypothetical protein